jgi:hypothetical protein|tara:strand:+ start:1439 stop:1804 length:366 start_codon:yes stop_codon:yes gene_type:complete
MSQSLDIIKHILDENLIDAKKATEGYLNDILSVAIKEQYKEVAPEMFEEGHKGKHDCAKKVKGKKLAEAWGEGTPIHGQHADPDENGNIAWYNVEFEHGIEEGVSVDNLEILVSEAHHDHK